MKKDILMMLESGLCEITFTKVDGTIRTIVGTLNRELIPAEKLPKGTSKSENEDVQPVYEVDLDQWRSFRWDSVIGYNAD